MKTAQRSKKVKGEGDYYVLLCDCGVGENRYMICGVMGSRKEAQELADEVDDCLARHLIKKCSVEITFPPPPRRINRI